MLSFNVPLQKNEQMKVVAVGTSSSKKSINKTFASYVASMFSSDVEVVEMINYEMPLYSVDREAESGIPELAKQFYDKLSAADVIVLSLAEHNGTYSAVFKNTIDWCSRINGEFFQHKPMVLLSTTTGKLAGKFVMDAALSRFPIHKADILGHFSLPFFQHNFDGEKVSEPELSKQLNELVAEVKEKLVQVEK